MAYDENLAERIRGVLPLREDLTEQKMFGGIAWMLDGKMFIGVIKDDLIARVGPARHEEALSHPHVRVFDFTGRPSRGMVYVDPKGHQELEAIAKWVGWAMEFVATLPKKRPTKPRTRKVRS